VRYTLVAGDGDTHNGDFSIVSNRLLAASVFDYETAAARSLRVRWEWIDALDDATVLDSGERALTVVVRNGMTDDDDGDGMTEVEEAVAGTDAQDSNSVLRADSAQQVGGESVHVQVFGLTNRLYTLQSSTDLEVWIAEVSGGATSAAGADAMLFLVDSNAVTGSKFYRISAGYGEP
jgi:hypothetical protein